MSTLNTDSGNGKGTSHKSVYVEVNLDSITNNVEVLRKCCLSSSTGVIGVVKAGAYGHGSVEVSHHLKSIGVERLAVATVNEGIHLRRNGVAGPIQIFGNTQTWNMPACLQYGLLPTLCSVDAALSMAKALESVQSANSSPVRLHESGLPLGGVIIKIDTGMSRNGCQPEQVSDLVKLCEDSDVPIDGMMTHFAASWDNQEFTQQQLDCFMDATQPYRSPHMNFHVANSGATLNGFGTDLDFIRPGIALYGLPPDTPCNKFKSFGLRPAAQIKGTPTLIKPLKPARKVGYSCAYITSGLPGERIATFPIGYADGYWRHLSQKGVVVRDSTGERCQLVGRVSMDAITVKVPEATSEGETFTLMTSDYDPVTSACGIAATVGTIAYEVGTRLSTRLCRVYTKGGSVFREAPALESPCY